MQRNGDKGPHTEPSPGPGKIVVMGGSFNPPTMAHFRMMRAAMDEAGAERGLFVPVSFPYLKRKMARAGQSHLALPDALRLKMLEAMCASAPGLGVWTEAMGDPFSDDVGVMAVIGERYPGAGLFYAAGADKLDLLDHFAEKSGFPGRFRCLLFARDSARLREEIANREHLAAHPEAFLPLDPPEGIEGISSTRVRAHLFDIDAVVGMLHPAVVPLVRALRPEDFPEEILRFREEYAFLANDYPARVEAEGIVYPCASSAFLAACLEDPAEKKRLAGMNPLKAKQKYGAATRDRGGKDITAVMEHAVRMKFRQNPGLTEKLRATGRRRLINGTGKDLFWGMNLALWKGENHLGRILMKIREEENHP